MYYEMENAFSKEQVDEITSIGDNFTLSLATSRYSADKRHQAIIEINKVKWLKKHIYGIAEKIKSKIKLESGVSVDISGGIEKNKAGHECFVYCNYGINESYPWHKDSVGLSLSRALSISLQLSDPTDYEKGELLFKLKENKTVTASKNKGNACIFTSSDTLHCVSPITKGTRKAAVFWFHQK